MATISENVVSRAFTYGITSNSREIIYDIQDAADEFEVQTLVLGASPAVYGGLTLDSVSGEPVTDTLWKGTARYIRLENLNEYTFDTSGGTQHVTQSLGTIGIFPITGTTAPDFQGAIGVSSDRVEGADITVPKYDFSETHIFTDAFMDAGYKRLLFTMTGSVCNATFKGTNSGETLFLGCSGTQRGNTEWSITFRFSCRQNVSGVTMGAITDITADGWDYVWQRYSTQEDSTAKDIIQVPIAVYVERVYPRKDFSTLLIGV